jgi:hypothetical protein
MLHHRGTLAWVAFIERLLEFLRLLAILGKSMYPEPSDGRPENWIRYR